MTSRLYDYILTVADASNFRNGNNLIGMTSKTFGYIANVDVSTNRIKVKVNNVFQEYSATETVVSNHYQIANVAFSAVASYTDRSDADLDVAVPAIVITDNPGEISVYLAGEYIPKINYTWNYDTIKLKSFMLPLAGRELLIRRDTGNTYAQSFATSHTSYGNSVTSASTSITTITNSPFIRSRNAFTQPPIVRLLTFYYPGEWYPPNEKGNPTGGGTGKAWPVNMPWRVAEVIGDVHSDLFYNVSFGGETYIPYPMETDGIGTSSDGTIDRVNIRLSNYDNIITNFVENSYLVGMVPANSVSGTVNGETVSGLDPATVPGNPAFNQTTIDTFYGKTYSPWTYESASAAGEEWVNLKYDSRDFLGGVVEIKSTLASHLQYWPEHSKLSNIVLGNVVQVLNTAPYRVGDVVKTPTSATQPTVVSLLDDNYLLLSANLTSAVLDDSLFIVNPEYDPDAYLKDAFKVVELSVLNENFAEFTLTSWLQYFKLQLPKRKFYKNTCQWEYKGSECQYPGPGGLPIPGTMPAKLSNAQNVSASNEWGGDDECAKSHEACRVRNNTTHFGAFPGTGRQIPKQ